MKSGHSPNAAGSYSITAGQDSTCIPRAYVFLKKSKMATAQRREESIYKPSHCQSCKGPAAKNRPHRLSEIRPIKKLVVEGLRDFAFGFPWNLKLKLRINGRPARQTGQCAQQSAFHPRTCLATRVLPSSQEAKVHLPIAVRLCSAHTALRKSPCAIPIFSILTRFLFAGIYLPGRSCICVESRLISLQLFRFTTLMTVRILPRLPA